MEVHSNQTTLNQFFGARKKSCSLQPSKRRKLESSTTGDIKDEQVVKTVNNQLIRKRTKQLAIHRINQKTNIKPCKKNEITTVNDDHKQLNRKQQKLLDNVDLLSRTKSSLKNSLHRRHVKLDDVDINPSINQQAKLKLFSNGQKLHAKTDVKLPAMVARAKPGTNLADISKNSEQTPGEVTKKLTERSTRSLKLRGKYAQLLKQNQKQAEQESLDCSNVTSPVSRDNLSKVAPQPSKSIPRHERAFSKHKHLVQKDTSVSSLVLPDKYKFLLEIFRCTDSVLFLLNQRKEICTFDRLKKSVQVMSGRDFTVNHLQTFKTIYPNAFIFRQERNLFKEEMGRTANYQLTIEINFKDAFTANAVSTTTLITRRLKFENALLKKTHKHHQRFLRGINITVNEGDIKHWHPNFNVNSVPDFELSLLPSAPLSKTFTTAAELIAKNRGFSPKVESALKSASDISSQQADNTKFSSSDSQPAPMVAPPKPNHRLKNVSSAILERIRQKEQKKHELLMRRDPIIDERLAKMERLPEIFRILNSYFIGEKKAAITLEDCVQKVLDSRCTPLPYSKCEEHIRLLAELIPTAISIVVVRKCPYVKLAKNVDLNNISNILATMKKNQESSLTTITAR